MKTLNFFQIYGRSIRNIYQHENRVKQLVSTSRALSRTRIPVNKWRWSQIFHDNKLARYADECESEVRLVNAMISYQKSTWYVKHKPMDLFTTGI